MFFPTWERVKIMTDEIFDKIVAAVEDALKRYEKKGHFLQGDLQNEQNKEICSQLYTDKQCSLDGPALII